MEFFGKFTVSGRNTISMAQEEAMGLGHNLIGTEHLLLGLIRDENIIHLLNEYGLTEKAIKDEVVKLVGKGQQTNSKLLGFSQKTAQIMEMSKKEGELQGEEAISAEHIFIAILQHEDNIATSVLLNLQIDVQELILDLRDYGDEEIFHEHFDEEATHIDHDENLALSKYGKDLTEEAKNGLVDPVIGRSIEIERVVQILSRRTKNNPCLVGEPGVGKTAIAEGLALKIANKDINESLKKKRIVTLDIASMLAGAKFRGEFEERLKKVINEVIEDKNIILFIDELHTIIGAGAAEGAIDASNILKPALARGEIQVIGATTFEEYRKRIEKDSALERRFQPITVEEPSIEDTVAILKGLREKYEEHHNVTITDNALRFAAVLSDRYITDRFLPDKAVDLVDEAASKIRLFNESPAEGIEVLENELEKKEIEKKEAVNNQDYEEAARIRDQEKEIKERIDQIKEKWLKEKRDTSIVDEEEIAHIVSDWTKIPVAKLTQDESDKLLNIENILHQRVIGQNEAVIAVSRAIRRARVGLKDPNKPVGSFIFLGPTGVGKTELSKALSEALFGTDQSIIRLDMSEYMEKHSISKMIGSPPGYVGYDEGGQLTEMIRRKPYSVILMDEIEKAHPDVFNLLLQILEDGRLTDSKGKVVDFKNAVVIMTSNVGAHRIKKQKHMGFAASDVDAIMDEYEKMKENIIDELEKSFKPEFLNRIDEVIVFHSLEKEHINEIIELLTKDLIKRVKSMNIYLEISDKAKAYIGEKGFDQKYGARPLKRTIARQIEDKFAEELLKGNIVEGSKIRVIVENEKIAFEKI